jgi:bifunctional non-homologous end joining protein LigD
MVCFTGIVAKDEFIEPMLARLVQQLPQGEQWSYEMKLDGYRCIAAKTRRGVQLFSRRKNSFNRRFPTIAEALERLEPETILDGEIVALDESGRPTFNLLQNYQSNPPIYFYVFDLLAYRGKSLLDLPLSRRRKLLESAVRSLGDPIRISVSFLAEPRVVSTAKELGLEGIVAKQIDSAYEPGKRSGTWVKYKINQGQEFVVGGYTPGNPCGVPRLPPTPLGAAKSPAFFFPDPRRAAKRRRNRPERVGAAHVAPSSRPESPQRLFLYPVDARPRKHPK